MGFLLIHGGWKVARYLPALCVSKLLLLTIGLSSQSSSYILVENRGSRMESVIQRSVPCISFLVLQLSCFWVGWFVYSCYLPRCDRSAVNPPILHPFVVQELFKSIFSMCKGHVIVNQKLITFNNRYDQNSGDLPVSQKEKRLLRSGVNLPELLWDIVVHLSLSHSHSDLSSFSFLFFSPFF